MGRLPCEKLVIGSDDGRNMLGHSLTLTSSSGEQVETVDRPGSYQAHLEAIAAEGRRSFPVSARRLCSVDGGDRTSPGVEDVVRYGAELAALSRDDVVIITAKRRSQIAEWYWYTALVQRPLNSLLRRSWYTAHRASD